MDSTILADAVATQDTVTQLIAAIRRVGRVVPGGAELAGKVCTGHDYSSPGKPRIDWDLMSRWHEGIIATTGCPGGEVQTVEKK